MSNKSSKPQPRPTPTIKLPDTPVGPQPFSYYFTAPFRYDGYSYIMDARNNMVADMRGESGCIRPRGWGRFQYMPDGLKIHDAVEALIIDTCKSDPFNVQHCIESLNALWGRDPVLSF